MKPHEQAKAWRKSRGLKVEDLADLTGYAAVTIWMFERGVRQDGKTLSKHSEWSWQRYRMACAGAEAQLKSGKEFSW